MRHSRASETSGNTVTSGSYSLEFDPATGMLAKLTARGRSVPLRGPRLAAWQRAPKLRSFIDVAGGSTLRKLELAPRRRHAGARANTTAHCAKCRGRFAATSWS